MAYGCLRFFRGTVAQVPAGFSGTARSPPPHVPLDLPVFRSVSGRLVDDFDSEEIACHPRL